MIFLFHFIVTPRITPTVRALRKNVYQPTFLHARTLACLLVHFTYCTALYCTLRTTATVHRYADLHAFVATVNVSPGSSASTISISSIVSAGEGEGEGESVSDALLQLKHNFARLAKERASLQE